MPSRSTYQSLAILTLLFTSIVFTSLYIEQIRKNEAMQNNIAELNDESSSVKAELYKVEKLLRIIKGPNKEYPSGSIALTYSHWFSYYSNANYTFGDPYICVYLPEDGLSFELFVEANAYGDAYHNLVIQRGTPDMDVPLPDLFVGPYVGRFNNYVFDAPSAGWYIVGLIGHTTPNWTGGGAGGWSISVSYDVQAQLRVLRSGESVLFGVGL